MQRSDGDVTETHYRSVQLGSGRERPASSETALLRRAEVKSEVNYLALLTKGDTWNTGFNWFQLVSTFNMSDFKCSRRYRRWSGDATKNLVDMYDILCYMMLYCYMLRMIICLGSIGCATAFQCTLAIEVFVPQSFDGRGFAQAHCHRHYSVGSGTSRVAKFGFGFTCPQLSSIVHITTFF